MKCGQAREWMSEYVDGVLDQLRTQALTDHLNGCAECREELSDLEKTLSLVREVKPVAPPPDLAAKVRARLSAGAGGERLVGQSWTWRVLISPPARVALAAGLLLVVGIYGLREVGDRGRIIVRDTKESMLESAGGKAPQVMKPAMMPVERTRQELAPAATAKPESGAAEWEMPEPESPDVAPAKIQAPAASRAPEPVAPSVQAPADGRLQANVFGAVDTMPPGERNEEARRSGGDSDQSYDASRSRSLMSAKAAPKPAREVMRDSSYRLERQTVQAEMNDAVAEPAPANLPGLIVKKKRVGQGTGASEPAREPAEIFVVSDDPGAVTEAVVEIASVVEYSDEEAGKPAPASAMYMKSDASKDGKETAPGTVVTVRLSASKFDDLVEALRKHGRTTVVRAPLATLAGGTSAHESEVAAGDSLAEETSITVRITVRGK